jgi:hypothetical protein
VAKTIAGEDIEINMKTSSDIMEDAVEETVDPWNYWVFNVGADANIELEELSRDINIGGDININRITDDWKINLSGRIEERLRRTIQKEPRVDENGNPVLDEDGNPIIDEVENSFDVSEFGFGHQLVKSISPQWSYGYDVQVFRIRALITSFRLSFRPALSTIFFRNRSRIPDF